MMEKERVIFRKEFDKYQKRWGYIAIFPDEQSFPGCVGIIPFKLDSMYDHPTFEPYCEASMYYVLSRKIVHKNTEEAQKCLKALEDYFSSYDYKFKVVEKM